MQTWLLARGTAIATSYVSHALDSERVNRSLPPSCDQLDDQDAIDRRMAHGIQAAGVPVGFTMPG